MLVGYSSADSIVGLAGNDDIQGLAGDDYISAGEGNDTVTGGAGSDTLIGGEGLDILSGGAGNDTYVFGSGFGQDVISDEDATVGNLDAIVLDCDILTQDVNLDRVGEDLVLSMQDTTDTITVENWFLDESSEWQVEEIRFSDGTVWDADAIKLAVLAGTPEDDVLKGYSSADTIEGLAGDDDIQGLAGDDYISAGDGNDTVTGDAGSDTLTGGDGLDILSGGAGNDTYVFGSGFAQDTITDYDETAGNVDTIVLGEDVLPSDVTLTAGDNDLFVSINGTDDSLKLSEWFSGDAWKIEQIQFSDGTVWDIAMMQAIVNTPSDADDYLIGTDQAEYHEEITPSDLAVKTFQFDDGTVLTPDEMILSGSICSNVHYHELCKVSKKAGAPRVLTGGRDSRALAAFRPEGTTVLGVAA